MKRVLITNAYSARNRGDAAIIHGMIDALRRTPALRDAAIGVSTVDHPSDAEAYPVRTVASFHSIKNRFSASPTVNLLFFLVVLLPLSLLWVAVRRLVGFDLPIPAALRGLMREYAAADIVVAAGGGYLYTTSRIHGNVVLLSNLFSFYVAVLLGVPVVLWAQSIGPFAADWQARLVRRTLAGVDLVEVREGVSRALIGSWGIATPVKVVADAAFAFEGRPPNRIPGIAGSNGGATVGITVRSWFRDPERQSEYERTMAAFVRWLVDERRAAVVFLPQVTFTDGRDDDREVARRVASAAARPDRIRLVEDDLPAAEIKGLCGRMDLFVGTRMHSNIFALSSGVPSLAIAYQPKTEGIMADLGLDDHVLRIDPLAVDDLQDRFDMLVAQESEIRSRLRSVIPTLREDALAGGAFVAEVLER